MHADMIIYIVIIAINHIYSVQYLYINQTVSTGLQLLAAVYMRL